MMGRPLQKWRTSEIHYVGARVSVFLSFMRSVLDGMESYLLLHVVKGIWRIDGEANEDDMRIWV